MDYPIITYQQRTQIIQEWFEKLKNNQINKYILLLFFKHKVDKEAFMNNEIIKSKTCVITTMQKLTLNILNNAKKKNIILVVDKEVPFHQLSIFKDEEKLKILFSGVENKRQFSSYINPQNPIFSQLSHQVQVKHLFYLEVQNPINIIFCIEYIKDFISIFLDYEDSSFGTFTKQSIKQYLFRNMPSITIETILSDIKYLERKYILTSRLAIFIYKICTFHYDASDKEIGIYFANELGTSRVYNNQRFNISNTKGYLINNMQNQREYNIKEDIARFLLKNKACDINILSQATGLETYQLNNLIRD